MTVTYRFKLPEEVAEQKTFSQAQDMFLAIGEFVDLLRDETKYAGKDVPGDIRAERVRISDAFWNILSDHKINPYEG